MWVVLRSAPYIEFEFEFEFELELELERQITLLTFVVDTKPFHQQPPVPPKHHRLMMPTDRNWGRNVHIFDASKPGGPAIGGLVQMGLISKAVFFDIIAIVVTTQPFLYLIFHRGSGTTIKRNPETLKLREYKIRSQAKSFNLKSCIHSLTTRKQYP